MLPRRNDADPEEGRDERLPLNVAGSRLFILPGGFFFLVGLHTHIWLRAYRASTRARAARQHHPKAVAGHHFNLVLLTLLGEVYPWNKAILSFINYFMDQVKGIIAAKRKKEL